MAARRAIHWPRVHIPTFRRRRRPAAIAPAPARMVEDAGALPPARRLVVVIPDPAGDGADLARRVWLLASPGGLPVLYIGLVTRADQELPARRLLATLASLTQDRHTRVETQVYVRRGGLAALSGATAAGDLVMVASSQPAAAADAAAALGVPVYTIAGAQPQDAPRATSTFRRWAFLAAAVAIVAGFFVIQIQVSSLPRDWAYYTLMSLSVVAESGAIWMWSRLLD